jgi:hypothetical protein
MANCQTTLSPGRQTPGIFWRDGADVTQAILIGERPVYRATGQDSRVFVLF